MEIRVEERLTGEEVRTNLRQKYGSLASRVAKAAERRAYEAKDDLLEWRLLEDAARRTSTFKVATVTTLSPSAIQRITPERLRIYQSLARARKPVNVTRLARQLRRDKKNVSEDVEILRRMGLLRATSRGREKLVSTRGNEIRVVFP